MGAMTLDHLRRYAVARTFFPPTTLARAIEKLGFVQADPIRAPARAQDLTLRHRVKGYRAGDLERRYPSLDLDEGVFVNYGFLRRTDYLRMHPRAVRMGWGPAARRRVDAIVEFIRGEGQAHPRDVEERFSHGKKTNYWGGSSNATTYLLGEMHYSGLLRVVRRDSGIRVYAVQDPPDAPADAGARRAGLDALVDLVVGKYAPLPAASLGPLIYRLRWGAPQWRKDLRQALQRARARLAQASIDGVEWYWPAAERPSGGRYEPEAIVRLLSPFDPLVWDRRRFEMFWDWAYRFEAYTPAVKRTRGYYALPVLWRDRVIGWANASWNGERLECELGFIGRRPRDAGFERELEAELSRLRAFLA